MPRYVAFLGSINVGGNRLTMADLRAAFQKEGFVNVETVVASGNVLFDHVERPTRGLEEKLGAMLANTFGVDAAVCVRDRTEVAAALAESPFAGIGADKQVHVHFLEAQPSAAQFAQLAQDNAGRGTEKLAPGTRALHVDFVEGVADSKLTSAFLARRLGCRGTARNVNSLRRVLEKMG